MGLSTVHHIQAIAVHIPGEQRLLHRSAFRAAPMLIFSAFLMEEA